MARIAAKKKTKCPAYYQVGVFPQAKLVTSQKKAYKNYMMQQVIMLRHLPPLIGLVRFTVAIKEAGWLLGTWQAEIRLGENIVAVAERTQHGYVIMNRDEAYELVREQGGHLLRSIDRDLAFI